MLSQYVMNPLFANLGANLLNKSKDAEFGKTDTSSALNGKVVGLYYSSHSCGPCRAFTPKLAKIYNKLKQEGQPFEIVFVSEDSSREEFIEYYKSMPDWFAAELSAIPRLEEYSGNGIPQLILFDENGKVSTDKGRYRILDESISFPWKTESSTEKTIQRDIDELLSYEEAIDKADYIYIRKTSHDNNKYSDDKIGQLVIIIGLDKFVYDFIFVRENNPQWAAMLNVDDNLLNELKNGHDAMGDMDTIEITVEDFSVILLSKKNALQKYLEIAKPLISTALLAVDVKKQEEEQKVEQATAILDAKLANYNHGGFDVLLKKAHFVYLDTVFSTVIEIYSEEYDLHTLWDEGWNTGEHVMESLAAGEGQPDCGEECHRIDFAAGTSLEQKKKKIRDSIQPEIDWKWGKRGGVPRQYYNKCDGDTCTRVWRDEGSE